MGGRLSGLIPDSRRVLPGEEFTNEPTPVFAPDKFAAQFFCLILLDNPHFGQCRECFTIPDRPERPFRLFQSTILHHLSFLWRFRFRKFYRRKQQPDFFF